MPELIPGRIRAAFRDDAAGSTVAEIRRNWEAEGFAPSNSGHQEQGERRTTWRDYEDSVDWTLDEALTPTTPLPSSLRIPAGESIDQGINIVDARAKWGEAGGGRLDRFAIEMSYRLNGQDWKRANGGQPRRS